MSLREYAKIARRWAWLVVAGALVAGIAAFLISSQLTPVYRAHAQLLVNQPDKGDNIYQATLGNQSLTKTYAELAISNSNLRRAADSVGNVSVRKLKDHISARAVPETQLFEVVAEDKDPQRAADLANAVANVLPGFIAEAQVGGASTDAGRQLNTVTVTDPAAAPEDPVRPNTGVNVTLGVLLGLLVMVGAVAVAEYFDDGVDEREDIERLSVGYLGSVYQAPVPRGADKATWVPSIIDEEAGKLLAESYRQVQASLMFALTAIEAKVILVTSPGQGEGKSTTAANLAEALAESSKRVLLIDGDLRKPDAHRYFSLPNSSGLTSTFLVDQQSLHAFTDRVGESLSVLTGGPMAPNPTELLSSRKLKTTLELLAEPYDLVVIDCPPLIGLADASLWMQLVDAVLLVARRGKTRRGALEEAVRMVRAARKPILGVVLNGADRRKGGIYGSEYGYTPARAHKSAEE